MFKRRRSKINEKHSNQILLIGYNRPEKILERLKELKNIPKIDVFVSIDWDSEIQETYFYELLKKEKNTWPKTSIFDFSIEPCNLGLAQHVTQAITKVLENHDSVIVIEDDVSISKSFIEQAKVELKKSGFEDRFASVGGYSVMYLPKVIEFMNTFRVSKYFVCWGWGTTREIWTNFRLDLSAVDIAKELNKSKLWKDLNSEQQSTWLGRFAKTAKNPDRTWDIQFQYMSFVLELNHLVPIGRVTENTGFADSRITNTKDLQPWWLGKQRRGTIPKLRFSIPVNINKFFDLVLSVSLIGDRAKMINKFKL